MRTRRRRNFFHRVQWQRYQTRPFQNPFFPKRPKHHLLRFAIGGLGLGVVLAIGSFFLTSPRFDITSVSVEGATSINPRIIRESVETYLFQSRFIFFNANNRFLYQEDELRKHLASIFNFEQLEIYRVGQNLRVMVREKVSRVIWMSGEHAYLADASGSITRVLITEELASLLDPPTIQGPSREGGVLEAEISMLVMDDRAKTPVRVGGSVFSAEEFTAITSFVEGLKRLNILTKRVEIDRTVGSWMRVLATVGYDILFDPTQNIEEQLGRLRVVLQEQISDPSELEYIDLRFGDHVYFK